VFSIFFGWQQLHRGDYAKPVVTPRQMSHIILKWLTMYRILGSIGSICFSWSLLGFSRISHYLFQISSVLIGILHLRHYFDPGRIYFKSRNLIAIERIVSPHYCFGTTSSEAVSSKINRGIRTIWSKR
jgi:Na+/H+-dicarboxylate symporter